MSKQVIVLGMHRSGTSVVGSICSCLGVDMGSSLLSGATDNPFGHFEDLNFLDLNDQLLKFIGSDWDLPPAIGQIDQSLGLIQKFSESAQMLVSKRTGIWGWKEPRTSITWPIYRPFVENPYIIICTRDANEVARSLEVRNGIPLDDGIKLKNIYDNHILSNLKDRDAKVLLIDYTDLKEDARDCVNRIDEFLGMQASEQNKRRGAELVKPKNAIEKKKKEIEAKRPSKLRYLLVPYQIPSALISKLRRDRKKAQVRSGIRYKDLPLLPSVNWDEEIRFLGFSR